MDRIRVMIVDDDIDWIKSMTEFLSREEDIYIAATATGRDEAVRLAQSIQLDVVLMDINLTGNKLDGIDAALEIRQMKEVKVIMLTVLKEESVITDSFTAGAINYIPKTAYKQIPEAIRSAYNKFSPYEILLKEYHRLKEEEQLSGLTSSEKEVYRLIEKGYSQSRIQAELHKTENTLRTQIKKILKKLGVGSSREAVRKVRSKGLFRKEG